MLEHTYIQPHIKNLYICRYNIIVLYMYIVICVPSLVEITPGVPELCWNIHTHKHTYINSHVLYIYILYILYLFIYM
jgi:hypothetical protein